MALINLPKINPTIRTPAVAVPNIRLPGSNLPATTVTGPIAPTAIRPATPAPLGDWRTPLNLTSNWGQANQPLSSWFTNPSDYVKTLMSITVPKPMTMPQSTGWTTSGPQMASWANPGAFATPKVPAAPVKPAAIIRRTK